MKRREFLKAAAFASAAPMLLIPRHARATPAFGRAQHVLILFAQGGFRSHATFNAVGDFQHNPFGRQPTAREIEWQLGAACGADDITTSSGVVPAFTKVAHDVAVLGAVDHLPGASVSDVDHRTATNRIATGDAYGSTGFLSLIGRHHPRYANGFTVDALPPVEIGPTEFGIGSGDYASRRPLSVFGAADVFAADRPVGKGWKIATRQTLDLRFRDRRPRAFRSRLTNAYLAKRDMAVYADLLADPRLNVLSEPEGIDGGFTNAALVEIFGNQTLDQIGDREMTAPWGPDVAMALRFFSLGAPACVVTRPVYDMHDDERTNYGPRTRDLVRQLAGLHHVLHAMPHPSGGKYWDHTVVAVVSEFARNNTMMSTGFNSGDGSDHVFDDPDPQRNQAIALMGGPITARGKLIGPTDERIKPLGKVFSSKSLLSTFFDLLGMDATPFWRDPPIEELFT